MKKKPQSYIRIPYLAVMALTLSLPEMAVAANINKKAFVYDYSAENAGEVVIEDLGNQTHPIHTSRIDRTGQNFYASEIETPRPPEVPPATPLPPETPRPFDRYEQSFVSDENFQGNSTRTLAIIPSTAANDMPPIEQRLPEPQNIQPTYNPAEAQILRRWRDEIPTVSSDVAPINEMGPRNSFTDEPQQNPRWTNKIPSIAGNDMPPINPDRAAPPEQLMPKSQPLINGIYIVNEPTKVYPVGLAEPYGVNFQQDVNVEFDEGLKTLLERDFIGQDIDNTLIPRLKKCIQNYYLECGHPLTFVCIPPQNVSCGIVQVIVQEARLGKVRTQGNCWNADELLTSYITICPGECINTNVLLNDLAWMNRNPFRHTQVSFAPGECPGTTDIELITTDKHPWRIYAGIDNTGSDETSQVRLFTGVTAGNLFGWDNVFTYQYTTSPDFRRYQSHTLNYRVPLSWKHLFMIYGGYAEVHPHIHGFHSNGFEYQASARYIMPLGYLYGDSLYEVTLGFDFKSTNNNLEFSDDSRTSIITGTVNLSQFMAGFNYDAEYGNFELLGSLLLYGSPGELFDRESKKDYQELRYKATPNYFYGQLYLGLTYNFSWGSEVAFLVRAQQSTANLLPSEQFGIGGFDTVRGYKEREVNTDNGFIVNAELRSPGYRMLSNYFCNCKWNDEIRFLAFFDYGKGFNHRLFPGERRDYQLASVGPGIRYQFMDNVHARLDWGIKLKRSSRCFGWGSKIHFGVIADF